MRIVLITLLLVSPCVMAKPVDPLVKIKKYLNELITIKAKFQQLSSNGQRNSGTLYMKKPGKLRMDFTSGKYRILVNGDMMLFENLKTGHQQPVGIGNTPAAVLLKQNLDLEKDVKLSVARKLKKIIIVHAQPKAGGQKVILKFSYPKIKLQGWQITDPQKITTQVRLSGIVENKSIKDSLFDSE